VGCVQREVGCARCAACVEPARQVCSNSYSNTKLSFQNHTPTLSSRFLLVFFSCIPILTHICLLSHTLSLSLSIFSLGIYRCLMVSHSYGTVIHNVFKHKFPGVVSYGIFLDPVCLMVHQPKVARMRSISLNELVARETKLIWWQKFITTWSFIVVFRDIFTQFVMCRTFFMEHRFVTLVFVVVQREFMRKEMRD